MPKKSPTPPPRAPKGSTTARLLLSLPPELLESSQDAARREGISVSEWWRRAAQERLGVEKP